MILRRLSQNVKDQNWTAIGIELLIVVLGVFVGLQFSNWNDARQHEQSERVYIERIREDLAANQDDLSQRLAYFRQTRAHGLATLDAIEEPIANLGIPFLIDVYQASQILPRGIGRDTYDEILSVGANSAISDVEVRKRITNFYSSISAQITTIEGVTGYRELVRTNMPYYTQAAIRSACDDVIETSDLGQPTITLPESCEPELSSEEVASSVVAISELGIQTDLIRRLSDLDAKIFSADLIIQRATMLDEYLATVLQ